MTKIALDCSIDPMTLAHALVYYEKVLLQVGQTSSCCHALLFIQGMISKSNRKLVSGAAMLIAVKINDCSRQQLTNLIDVSPFYC
jgi:hypothetical protein